jgi:amino acid transporter
MSHNHIFDLITQKFGEGQKFWISLSWIFIQPPVTFFLGLTILVTLFRLTIIVFSSLVVRDKLCTHPTNKQQTPWSESASELYRPSDRRFSAKWLPTCADRGCYVVSVTSLWPYSRFSRQEPLLFYQVAPQLYSRGWVDPVPDPLVFFLVVPGIEPGPPNL